MQNKVDDGLQYKSEDFLHLLALQKIANTICNATYNSTGKVTFKLKQLEKKLP